MKKLISTFEKELKCKHCNEETLHIEKIHIFNGKDGYETTETLTYTPEKTTMSKTVNPSNVRVREPSLILEIYCEGCAEANDLTIASHKGKIYVD